ncbi:monooxygenase [Bacillus sp. FJAT-42376]|uniref:FAD-dependent monooxygenase n=1 Tax=Bacillus sp. FJAT-42376 TaxID=2014076 RepID=UPI000F4D6DF4|nr:FAD-dependent monooxygenase [Bacillus sp. FJAT-42376]AZB42423.1 monooxygenase [Bacillus sp. FJAT-42376]
MSAQVLITGAGPTGLVLALRLAGHGVPFRIIDQNKGPGESSRALVIHARTLEFYRQLGFAEELIELGIKMKSVRLLENGQKKAKLELADLGAGLSPFPFILSLAQDVHEQFLVKKLQEQGIEVEWETELLSFTDYGDEVEAVICKNGKTEWARFDYICGCDGAHSTVRKTLNFKFSGGTYEELFYVADVKAADDGMEKDGFYMFIDQGGFCAFIPVRTTGMRRVVGIVPNEMRDSPDLSFENVRPIAEKQLGLAIHNVNWFSTYRVHHRVSEHFRKGRAFIAGDAGHIHSPAGGQGMNTGIGDAVNLSWKLAAVLQGKADPDILDTYETERIAFARLLVSTTDRAFRPLVGRGFQSKLIRKILFPLVIPALLKVPNARKRAFNLLSQTRIHYRGSKISDGKAGSIHGGDRLPWIKTDRGDNYEPLKSMKWQIHVYGKASRNLREFAVEKDIELIEFEWNSEMAKAGFERDAVYWVRPDGHVGFAFGKGRDREVRDFILK